MIEQGSWGWIERDGKFSSSRLYVDVVGVRETLESVPLSTDMEVISSLKPSHDAFKSWPKRALDVRWRFFEALRTKLKSDREEILELMKMESNFSLFSAEDQCRDFFELLEEFSIEDFGDNRLTERGFREMWSARGLIGFVLDSRHPWLSWLGWVIKAAVAGNVTMVRFLPENVRMATYIHRITGDLDIPSGVLQIFVGNDTGLEEMMCSHPSMASVLVECGDWDTGRYRNLLTQRWRPFGLFGETRPVAFLFSEAKREWAREILRRAFMPGPSFLRVNRLFTLDKLWSGWEEAFREEIKLLGSTPFDSGSMREGSKKQWVEQVRALKVEKGLEALDGGGFFSLDFSNCSAIHQQVVQGPFFSLTRSKYVHEAQKFAQTTPHRQHASLFAPDDKLEVWSKGISFSQVHWNQLPRWRSRDLWQIKNSPPVAALWGASGLDELISESRGIASGNS